MLFIGAVALGIFWFLAQQREVLARQAADEARVAAERQTRLALARQLASQASLYSAQDRQLGLLLATNAVSITLNLDGSVDPDADRALRKLLHATSHITMTGGLPNALRVTFDPTGTYVAAGGLGVRVWNAHTGELLHSLDGHGEGTAELKQKMVQSISFNGAGDRLVSAGWDGTARVWEVATGRQLFVLRGHTDTLTDAAFSPDGTRIATAGIDRYVTLWDAATGQPIQQLPTDSGTNNLAFSPDGRLLASANASGSAYVWNGHDGSAVFKKAGPDSNGFFVVSFSPDSKAIAVAGFSGTTFIWDTQTGDLMTRLEGHRGLVYQIAYSADGRRIATAADDYTARVWNAQTGEEQLRLTHTSQTIRTVAFRPDGNQIATGGTDNVVRLWNAKTGAQEGVLREDRFRASFNANISIGTDPSTITASSDQPLYWIFWVAYSPSGDRVVSAGGDEVDVSIADPRQLLALARSELTRGLTCEEQVLFLNEKRTCSTNLQPPPFIQR
jgi:WD40 repeat protein